MPVKEDADLAAANALFAGYLAQHDFSTIERVKRASGDFLGIKKPWGEDGIVIFIPQDDSADLAEALNNVILPKPFTAIYHRDTRKIEVIWTAFPITGHYTEAIGRKFSIEFEGALHECEFGNSSDRLLAIAEFAAPVGVSDTQHRNLQSYNQYLRWKRETKGKEDASPPPGVPYSFWISNFDWDQDLAIRFAQRLNFYLTYYDALSPALLIWPTKSEAANPRARYIRGAFPNTIVSDAIDDDLLHFWHAARDGDAGRKFVYNYRIIEHASYGFIERNARIKTKRLLSTAHEFSDKKDLCDKVIATVLGAKEMDDGARIAAMLAETVDPVLIWNEIVRNKSAFQTKITFDGGYISDPIVSKDDTSATFAVGGLGKFAQAARHIRNHLSHGRDRRTLSSITPTIDNFRKLEPWVGALSVAAGEAINHRNVS